jgi:hypothetical protein
MPLMTFTPIATVAIQGRIALKCTPAWSSTSREPNQALISCSVRRLFGFPAVTSLRLRSE